MARDVGGGVHEPHDRTVGVVVPFGVFEVFENPHDVRRTKPLVVDKTLHELTNDFIREFRGLHRGNLSMYPVLVVNEARECEVDFAVNDVLVNIPDAVAHLGILADCIAYAIRADKDLRSDDCRIAERPVAEVAKSDGERVVQMGIVLDLREIHELPSALLETSLLVLQLEVKGSRPFAELRHQIGARNALVVASKGREFLVCADEVKVGSPIFGLPPVFRQTHCISHFNVFLSFS